MELTKLSKLKTNPKNPRTITDAQFERLKDSLLVFPKMLTLRPLATDGNGIVLGGNMRLRALKDIAKMTAEQIAERLQGMKTYNQKSEAEQTALVDYWRDWLTRKDVPTTHESTLTDAEKDEFVMTDNASFGSWDFDAIANEWDAELVEEWGVDVWQDDVSEDFNEEQGDKIEHGKLVENYVVPPFSVLDTKQGYWQERKKQWLEITGNLSETRDGEFGTISGGTSRIFNTINGGTSNFDPVLAELIIKWFCKDGGKVLDPFGGEQTKGVVAGELGVGYWAVEIRKEQVELNESKTANYPSVHYACGDSNNISKLIKERDFDLCFTSPPYYDLEVYSKEDMSALGTYEEFLQQYKNIFKQCVEMLRDDAFLVVKVCEIRDKKTGIYRNFVGDNIRIMTELGLKYYNEIILYNSIGTGALRANKNMATRKIVKVHQNVLVFYKGDPKNISQVFPPLVFNEQEFIDGADS